VNPLEVIYASFPAFLYLNSSFAGKLLEPLFETNVTTDMYKPEHAKLDLGVSSLQQELPMRNLHGGDVGGEWPIAHPNDTIDYQLGVECEFPQHSWLTSPSIQICSIWLNAHFGAGTCPEVRRQKSDLQILQPPTQVG